MPLDLTHRSPLVLERIRHVEVELAEWAAKAPAFDFEVEGTELFRMMELLYAYAKRADDLAASTKAMLYLDRLTPAVLLARALIETTAMGAFYVAEMFRLIDHGKLENLQDRFRKFYEGRMGEEVSGVHVNDALRHLEALDNAGPVAAEPPEAAAEIAEQAQEIGGLDLASPNFVETSYGALCEVAHPSCIGTHLIYPAPGQPDAAEAKQRLAFACELAIWQAQYLLTALYEGEGIPAAYRAKFMPG
ncbi:hypothetical protein [Phenylobacterium sp.]|jgi:hypothetical protein|uniref:hypothetical protein n=1 Tax=Phenylobacterium sp. TaxID=1871053 RepID=UPI002F946D6F